ncbi:hypothetical protein SAMN05216249_11187 [Acetitomaculum ruminis DSM 5522]|uniref:Uncharacterized protein n=1 Tax=Acetitomaculum ruminis DSM 5522 TaxID=1120918 RepID=A0A1I0YW01_9FIRM|nr:hypothetical protein [Acetitomaculum ruminis]SFB17197.1 hypothetical protein SAMN05216249_11187 [Acetitomaculum ruminis DSM 5522]
MNEIAKYNFYENSRYVPGWMIAERYEYCDDFYYRLEKRTKFSFREFFSRLFGK